MIFRTSTSILLRPSTLSRCNRVSLARNLTSISGSDKSVRPRNVLLVKKTNDEPTTVAAKTIISHLRSTYPNLNILIESEAAPELSSGLSGVAIIDRDSTVSPNTGVRIWARPDKEELDLIITLGGDGTILHVSSLYARPGKVPPVLSFSMGSLGFLTPFHIDTHEETIGSVFDAKYKILDRMRLACEIFGEDDRPVKRCPTTGWQVMNEVSIHRGRYPHLSVVDAYVDGEHLTEAVADGLILATPTGSTAYSLSSGGPIAHPGLEAFLLTPIAPRSLSFRTLLLPSQGEVMMKISGKSRAPSELSMDGREVCNLHPGEYIKVRRSRYPIPCVTRRDGGDDWVADINSLLQFNVGFKNSSLWRRHTPV
ncbi:hypothetical protein FFLO_04851 [Filobasidium floriforme]|uniref:NADH kinase n=1 Tax=Filobasidium floriforme TaxID=5210 RepID=A0A8K0JJJ1_9TREE|nr:ATP-NAD kinase-like domain-containing protein [Filobasidium floriforme]KAG7530681.1 hypothetical protein FFLO_04851 [Filobasidium floriforme]KAH8077818.1 ATP-NAD kinase-like domain-containing protein [Filobasidium floriforme]